MITGVNYDDPLLMNNGVGKTTILYSICWGLYGQTPVGEKGDDILPRQNPKNAEVTMLFKDGKDTIKVSRYRKHKQYENSVTLSINDVPVNAVDNKDTV